jgi:thymidylate kinase
MVVKHRFIVFEGIDGSGKTSLAKEFAKRIHGFYYHSPSSFISPLRYLADVSPLRIKYHYYRLSHRIAALEIRHLLRKTDVVCDRYMYTTVAYHDVLLKKELGLQRILVPDKIVFVSAGWKEIKRRLSKRGAKIRLEYIPYLRKVQKRYGLIFSKMDNVIRFDTTGKRVSDVVESLLKKI